MLNQMFITKWNRFEQLALLNYASEQVIFVEYGFLKDLNSVRNFAQGFDQVPSNLNALSFNNLGQ
jgi:hypothetical protein